jgi:hypothetical protein
LVNRWREIVGEGWLMQDQLTGFRLELSGAAARRKVRKCKCKSSR